MKIEVGKTYRNRVGGVVTITQFDKSNDGWPFVGSDHLTYSVDGAWRSLDYGDKEDLVEECNADGSPIVVQSNPLTADRSWRNEIALRLLPALIVLGSDLEGEDPPNDTQGEIAVNQAFYIADVFLKAAKQS